MSIIKEWHTKAGLPAQCRQNHIGYFCGYVGITKDHPLFGVEYPQEAPVLRDAANALMNKEVGSRGVFTLLQAAVNGVRATPEMVFNVHGSLTFSDHWNDPSVWWFGFDCAHCDDDPITHGPEYVARQCESLAEQLALVVAEAKA